MLGFEIIGTGHYVPGKPVTNHDLSRKSVKQKVKERNKKKKRKRSRRVKDQKKVEWW